MLKERYSPQVDGDSGPDVWADIPEELEPVDEDGLDDSDYLPTYERRRQPIITYSRAHWWPPPEGVVPIGPATNTGDLHITVRHAAIDGGIDGKTADLLNEELYRLATALERWQSRSLRATSCAEAFVQLDVMSQKVLANAAEISTTGLSRRRREVIEAPWGLVPLEFFWWRRPIGLDLAELRALAATLRSEPELADRAVARRVAETEAAPNDVAKRTEAIRKQVPIMRSLLPLLPTLNHLARALTETDLDELERQVGELVRRETGASIQKRGHGLVRLALAGAFLELEMGP